MAAAAEKQKRDFTVDEAYLLWEKYTLGTLLTVVEEVGQHEGKRVVDWTALVAKTATGIKSAREYKMLWRHLAYLDDFVEDVDDGAQHVGDPEGEMEPFPIPSKEDRVIKNRIFDGQMAVQKKIEDEIALFFRELHEEHAHKAKLHALGDEMEKSPAPGSTAASAGFISVLEHDRRVQELQASHEAELKKKEGHATGVHHAQPPPAHLYEVPPYIILD